MNTINDFVEATLNLTTAENDLRKELVRKLHISESNIKSITLKNIATDNKVLQTVVVELTGINHFKGKDIKEINGLTIVTPNTLEIDAGELIL